MPQPISHARRDDDNSHDVRLSKTMSFLLRHEPGQAGLTLEPGGWVTLDDLTAGLNLFFQSSATGQRGGRNPPPRRAICREDVLRVIAACPKRRFGLSPDGHKVRASQGHSTLVDLELRPASPPMILYHGTTESAWERIGQEGLTRQARHHVHLSADRETAERVGSRRGRPVVLVVEAASMVQDGFSFFVSDNGVWLVESVPPRYLARS